MPHLHRYLGNPVLTALGRFLFQSLAVISTVECAPSAETVLSAWTSVQRHGICQRNGGKASLFEDEGDRGADDALS